MPVRIHPHSPCHRKLPHERYNFNSWIVLQTDPPEVIRGLSKFERIS